MDISAQFVYTVNGMDCSSQSDGIDAGAQVSCMQNHCITTLLLLVHDHLPRSTNLRFDNYTHEGKILEGSLGQNMEKVIKAHTDALWARLPEENAKQEKLE
ncbi:hypothetical protein JHK86_010435 [Glycine max]|nr:hypothetical protein JHK86_010435 [Glycine max]